MFDWTSSLEHITHTPKGSAAVHKEIIPSFSLSSSSRSHQLNHLGQHAGKQVIVARTSPSRRCYPQRIKVPKQTTRPITAATSYYSPNLAIRSNSRSALPESQSTNFINPNQHNRSVPGIYALTTVKITITRASLTTKPINTTSSLKPRDDFIVHIHTP
ncbi:hypothetical protein Droror1_Dr00004139 [Drosera rotundifolia]